MHCFICYGPYACVETIYLLHETLMGQVDACLPNTAHSWIQKVPTEYLARYTCYSREQDNAALLQFTSK